MDDAMILPCGHFFGNGGIQHILKNVSSICPLLVFFGLFVEYSYVAANVFLWSGMYILASVELVTELNSINYVVRTIIKSEALT